ncbi:MAG: hypothetical protein ACI4I5_10705 [Acutalibacteraceae bacterium]
MLKRTVCKITALVLLAAVLFSFAGCGGGSVRVRSVAVVNSDFFEQIYDVWRFGDQPLQQGDPLYSIACAFSGTYEAFEKTFLYKYDSYLGMECRLDVTNKTEGTITATGIRVTNDGYEDTYISTRLGACEDVPIPAGETVQVSFLFLGNGSIYTNEEFINKVFPQMPMELVYTDASGTQMTAPVQFKSVKAVS